MGRHDTVTTVKIRKLCQYYAIDQDELKKRTKKILSVYSDLVTMTAEDALAREGKHIEKDPVKAVEKLEGITSETNESEVFDILRMYFERDWFIEIVDTAMCMVKEFKHDGDLYFDIISKIYLSNWKYTENEMLDELRLDRSRFYDRKREAILLFGVFFWFKALPLTKKYATD